MVVVLSTNSSRPGEVRIFLMNNAASLIEGILNNIHKKFTSMNVMNTRTAFLMTFFDFSFSFNIRSTTRMQP